MKPPSPPSRIVIALVLLLASLSQNAAISASTPPPPPPPDGTAGTGGVQAADVGPAVVVPGGPGYVSLSPFAFHPADSTYTWRLWGGFLYNTGTTTWASLNASVPLPNGATVTRLVGYFSAADPSQSGNLELWACPLDGAGGGGCGRMASVSPAVNAGYTQTITTTISLPVVNNAAYGYMLLVNLPPTTTFKLTGARVDYTFALSLPAVLR